MSNNTITLAMIVKNESKIIERCLESTKNFVDYIVITDTGSTDNTVDLIENYLKTNDIKGKVYKDEWKNFGYNRTNSFINAREWLDDEKIDKNNNYILTIDADMILKNNKIYNKTSLTTADNWLVVQKNNTISYYNSRLFRASLPFKCVGVTHEYWGCDVETKNGKIKEEDLYIDDRGDGGAKSDKFERDIRLLTKGIEDEPNNHRYYFYLAQTYGDLRDYENAIKWYRKRIDAGGWKEEIYVAHLKIGEFYSVMGQDDKAIYEWVQAYEVLPERSESLYRIANYYRLKGKNFSSLLYTKSGIGIEYPKDLLLFIEFQVYNYKFIEELSIIGYYTNKKLQASMACQYLLLTKDIPKDVKNTALSNNYFYLPTLEWKTHKTLSLPTENPYISSSSCLFLNKNGGMRGIVRSVNYSLNEKFVYSIRDSNNIVRTKNYWAEFDKNGNVLECYELKTNIPKVRTSHIDGLEDIRCIFIENKLFGLSVDWEYGRNNHPSVILTGFEKDNSGKYFINKLLPITYNDNICQKNWVPFAENNKLFVVYSHHPLTILEVNTENGEYDVILEKYSDYDLSNMRGSGIPVKLEDGSWLFIVHEVVFKDTRKYYHRFLRYSKNWELLDISFPFYFKKLFVEFTLSLMYDKNNKEVFIPFSTKDNTTEYVSILYEKIGWLPKDMKKWLIDNI
jgi:glycosyltransferase involved in cell wall biosynthesis